MKGYALLLAVAAILLLVLPLPALPAKQMTVATPSSEETPTTGTTATTVSTSTTVTPATEDSFRILVGEEVVTLSQRDFLIRTLAFEIGPAYHPEALKAQAVAAATYYGRRRAAARTNPDPALKGADFASADPAFPGNYTADALKTRWGDAYEANMQTLAAAVDEVAGTTITYEGQLIDACYFAMSSGTTESAATVWGNDIPYLQAVASPGDCLANGYQTTVTLSAQQVKDALLAAYPTVTFGDDPATWLAPPVCSTTGHVTSITVGGTALKGTQLRQALGLRSANFTVSYRDNQFTFTTKGYGHGVGMSQTGANYLAGQGYTYQEILQYYYKNVTVG